MRPIRLGNHRGSKNGGRGRSPNGELPRTRVLFLLEEYLRQVQDTLELLPLVDLARVGEELLRARARGRTVYVMGNGGSAATASHAVADWMKPNRRGNSGCLRTFSLVDNVSLVTAWANDTSFDNVFAAQLESLLRPGDVVVAISGSGNSPNVLRAVETATKAGAVTIGFSGFSGGRLGRVVDIDVVVPCDNQKMIEDIHVILVHALTSVLVQSAEMDVRKEAEEIEDEEVEEPATQSAAG
ncbi:MAG: SIS domain-containing protein [Dehalococcoidia bacterium]|nr:SIS domain-containing protein [Dehalococcoidia bacterium]